VVLHYFKILEFRISHGKIGRLYHIAVKGTIGIFIYRNYTFCDNWL